VQGYYGRDHAMFAEYHQATRERDGFLTWLNKWILEIPDLAAYRQRLGERLELLRPGQPQLAAPVDYA
jgi:glutaconate CoA-transferase subunit A